MQDVQVFDFTTFGAMEIVGYVPCGKPWGMLDKVSGESLHRYLRLSEKQTFVFIARGDSMTGAGIYDGDPLIVDTAQQPRNGGIALVSIGDEFTVKRVMYETSRIDGSWEYQRLQALYPENPQYPVIYPDECDDIVVIGTVCGKWTDLT